jgi:hypothetical protein
MVIASLLDGPEWVELAIFTFLSPIKQRSGGGDEIKDEMTRVAWDHS